MNAHDEEGAHARRMVALLVDGLRYGAGKRDLRVSLRVGRHLKILL